jgi:hypothetical protein
VKTLEDVCREIENNLKEVAGEIAALEANLAFFEERAARWPGEQVALRLQTIASAIAGETARLLNEHDGRGFVGVWTGKTGTASVVWQANREVLADKEYYRARGETMLFAFEMRDQIKALVTGLADGGWVPAVAWLNAHTIYSEKGERLS